MASDETGTTSFCPRPRQRYCDTNHAFMDQLLFVGVTFSRSPQMVHAFDDMQCVKKTVHMM